MGKNLCCQKMRSVTTQEVVHNQIGRSSAEYMPDLGALGVSWKYSV